MKMYKTQSYNPEIQPVEVLKATPKTVWFNEGRAARHSDYISYWDTFEEARAHLIKRYERSIIVLRGKIANAESALNELKQKQNETTNPI